MVLALRKSDEDGMARNERQSKERLPTLMRKERQKESEHGRVDAGTVEPPLCPSDHEDTHFLGPKRLSQRMVSRPTVVPY